MPDLSLPENFPNAALRVSCWSVGTLSVYSQVIILTEQGLEKYDSKGSTKGKRLGVVFPNVHLEGVDQSAWI
jgi:hypothetical protein